VLAGRNIDAVHALVARVDGDLFGTLGIVPALGRSFRADEIAAQAPVVVLSDPLWRRQFRGDPAVIGAVVTIDGLPHTVVGVTAPNRAYPRDADVWRPLTAREKEGNDRELTMIARLREDVPIARATAELGTLARATSSGARTAWADEMQRTDVKNVRTALNAVLASSVLVLLIVCANVAALVGARARRPRRRNGGSRRPRRLAPAPDRAVHDGNARDRSHWRPGWIVRRPRSAQVARRDGSNRRAATVGDLDGCADARGGLRGDRADRFGCGPCARDSSSRARGAVASAVSKNVTPRSTAARMIAMPSSRLLGRP
jgi:hypothetical protein